MKFLLAFVAFSACIVASTMGGAVGYGSSNLYGDGAYNIGPLKPVILNTAPLNPEAYANVKDSPVGLIKQQTISAGYGPSYDASLSSYGGSSYGAPLSSYGGSSYGASSYGPSSYGLDPQLNSLVKMTLALRTPEPDASINGKGYGYNVGYVKY